MHRITGFHRIRHYGAFANTQRADVFAKVRELLRCSNVHGTCGHHHHEPTYACPHCGGAMTIIEIIDRAHYARAPPLTSGVQ